MTTRTNNEQEQGKGVCWSDGSADAPKRPTGRQKRAIPGRTPAQWR